MISRRNFILASFVPCVYLSPLYSANFMSANNLFVDYFSVYDESPSNAVILLERVISLANNSVKNYVAIDLLCDTKIDINLLRKHSPFKLCDRGIFFA